MSEPSINSGLPDNDIRAAVCQQAYIMVVGVKPPAQKTFHVPARSGMLEFVE
jgi:hypothetical protein